LWVILLVSGALGFRIGIAGYGEWQVAVETAQVVARLVQYPSGNPFYVYHTKVWSILHQLLAVLLWSGLSERTLSLLVTGVLGMVSFQALSLFVYAFSGDVLLSIGTPPLILFTRIAEVGTIYPIWLVGTTHTYGILGLGYAALVAGCLGAGWVRTGLFLLGAAPSVHPSIGVWLVALIGVAALWDFRRLVDEFRPAAWWFAGGCAVTALSLGVQFAFIYDAPSIDPAVAKRYLAAFAGFWDGHRRPVPLRSDGVAVNIAALVAAAAWLRKSEGRIPRSAQFLLRFVIVTGAFSLILTAISWIPPDRLPAWLLILMPGRVLNLNGMTFAALLVGVVGAYRAAAWSGVLTLGLFAGLVFGNRSMYRGEQEILNSVVILLAATLVAIVAVWLSNGRASAASRVLRAATVVVMVWAGREAWRLSGPTPFTFLDRTNDPVFQQLSKGTGVLVTGGNLHLIQLRTRRPVLLDGGALDGLPYALEAGPQMDRILRDVYSIDLFNPPEEARYTGSVPSQHNRTAWEGFTAEKWQAIAHQYGVSQVVTPGYWDLKLPVAGQNRTVTVYDIPHTFP
jgi:hypothetical protein